MRTIIIPTDFSEIAERVYHPAASIAERTDCKIILLHNVRTLLLWNTLSQDEKSKHKEIGEQAKEAESKLDELINSSVFRTLKCDKIISHGLTHEQILATAKAVNADLIMLGSHGDLPGRSFIDSTIQKVIIQSHCPVMTVGSSQARSNWKKILVPLSFNEDVHKSFKAVHDLALELKSTVHLVYINRPEKFKETSKIENQMKDFSLQYPDLEFEFGYIDSLEMESGILEYVGRVKPDYIAMVTHNRKHHARYLISTTEAIVYHASIPVISIPIVKDLPIEVGAAY